MRAQIIATPPIFGSFFAFWSGDSKKYLNLAQSPPVHRCHTTTLHRSWVFHSTLLLGSLITRSELRGISLPVSFPFLLSLSITKSISKTTHELIPWSTQLRRTLRRTRLGLDLRPQHLHISTLTVRTSTQHIEQIPQLLAVRPINIGNRQSIHQSIRHFE